MNHEQLAQWKDAIEEHNSSVKSVLEDRIALKEFFEGHLKQFFDYDKIEYENNFHKIILKWKYDHFPFIISSKLSGLYMDFTIACLSDDDLGMGVHIIVYPFGLEESDN